MALSQTKLNVELSPERSNGRGVKGFWLYKILFYCIILPYLVGYWISANNIEIMNKLFQPVLDVIVPHAHAWFGSYRFLTDDQYLDSSSDTSTASVPKNNIQCYKRFLDVAKKAASGENPFDGISVVLHRNGEALPCGEVLDIASSFKAVLENMHGSQCMDSLFTGKYPFESLLTQAMHHATKQTSCYSLENDTTTDSGLYGFCDQGEARTPILLDHLRLVRIQEGSSMYLPCHFHDMHGVRVTSLTQLVRFLSAEDSNRTQDCSITPDGVSTCDVRKEFHLYAVPAGRVLIHAPAYIGQIISLPHVTGADPTKPVYMKVLSLEPKVFDIMNFFTKTESEELVARALAETRESHRVKRSTTGASGASVNRKRTSESGFDTDGKIAMSLKRRCFDLLGFDEYIEGHADGLQILRYNLTKAYTAHLDWIDGNDQLEHNYESEFKGGNRFATILLYFSDLGDDDGGETVFTEAWPSDVAVEDRLDLKTAVQKLRDSPQGNILEKNSWEEDLVAKCRSRLAVHPQSARAVLFYSQLPNGRPDQKSLHGGCPVLNGTKYAANLWVWNTPRDGYTGNPKNPNFKGEKKEKEEEFPGRITGIFRNSGKDPALAEAELYYIDDFWQKLGPEDEEVSVNTYPGHVWNVKIEGQIVKTFTITKSEPKTQEFVI